MQSQIFAPLPCLVASPASFCGFQRQRPATSCGLLALWCEPPSLLGGLLALLDEFRSFLSGFFPVLLGFVHAFCRGFTGSTDVASCATTCHNEPSFTLAHARGFEHTPRFSALAGCRCKCCQRRPYPAKSVQVRAHPDVSAAWRLANSTLVFANHVVNRLSYPIPLTWQIVWLCQLMPQRVSPLHQIPCHEPAQQNARPMPSYFLRVFQRLAKLPFLSLGNSQTMNESRLQIVLGGLFAKHTPEHLFMCQPTYGLIFPNVMPKLFANIKPPP